MEKELVGIVKTVEQQFKGVLSNKSVKAAGIGAVLGYTLTRYTENKTRNAMIGAAIGYLLSAKGDEDKEE